MCVHVRNCLHTCYRSQVRFAIVFFFFFFRVARVFEYVDTLEATEFVSGEESLSPILVFRGHPPVLLLADCVSESVDAHVAVFCLRKENSSLLMQTRPANESVSGEEGLSPVLVMPVVAFCYVPCT